MLACWPSIAGVCSAALDVVAPCCRWSLPSLPWRGKRHRRQQPRHSLQLPSMNWTTPNPTSRGALPLSDGSLQVWPQLKAALATSHVTYLTATNTSHLWHHAPDCSPPPGRTGMGQHVIMEPFCGAIQVASTHKLRSPSVQEMWSQNSPSFCSPVSGQT